MASPIIIIPQVNLESFPFVGSVVTCNQQSTVIALACPASIANQNAGICPFNPTITYGPSTYALTVSNNQFNEGPTAVSCNATSSTPKFCTTVEQQSTFDKITYSGSIVASIDLTSAPVTLTAGVEKLCAGISGLSYASETPATTTSGSIAATGVTSTMPSQTSSRNTGSRNGVRTSSMGLMLCLLPLTWILMQTTIL